MVLAERNEEVEALPPEAAKEPFAKRVRLGGLHRREEDADAHRGDGLVEAQGVDTISITEDESVGVPLRQG
jgi:hypothetical protein